MTEMESAGLTFSIGITELESAGGQVSVMVHHLTA